MTEQEVIKKEEVSLEFLKWIENKVLPQINKLEYSIRDGIRNTIRYKLKHKGDVNAFLFDLFTDYKVEVNTEEYFKQKKVKENKEEKINLKQNYINLIAGKEKNWGEASEILTQFIKSKMWIYTTKDDVKTEVWVYDDGIYVPQGKSEIKKLLREILGEFYSAYIYNLVIAKIEPDTFIDADKFFKISYPDEVPLLNGILNIRTLALTEYNPEKIFFSKMPVKFDTTKECPKIDQFLKDILKNEDDVNIIYELAGFGLLDEYKFEKAFMLLGNGRNGKGKMIELFKRLFGIENCCSISLMSLKTNDFSISNLFGKKLNLAGDIGYNDLKETCMFKSLTGRDLVGAKRKFLQDLFFTNSAKFVFACNELPMVYDMSKGFWDRWILLDFPYTFVNQNEYDKAEDNKMLKIRDDDIIGKIISDDELSGLLNQSLLGLNRLESQKRFSTTRGSEEVKQVWIRKSNSFIAFCLDMIEDSYDSRISKRDLRKKYAKYCKEHKIPTKSDFVIKRVLQETYGANEIRGVFGEFNVRNDFWEGITWKK